MYVTWWSVRVDDLLSIQFKPVRGQNWRALFTFQSLLHMHRISTRSPWGQFFPPGAQETILKGVQGAVPAVLYQVSRHMSLCLSKEAITLSSLKVSSDWLLRGWHHEKTIQRRAQAASTELLQLPESPAKPSPPSVDDPGNIQGLLSREIYWFIPLNVP